MNEPLHILLKRQIERHFGAVEALPEQFRGFIAAVNSAYDQFNGDRLMLERALELSSKELFEKNQDMQAVFQSSPDIFFWMDHDGTILNFRTNEQGMLYVKPGDFLGKRMQDVLPPDVGKQFQEALYKLNRTQTIQTIEYRLQVPFGLHDFEARVLPLSDGKLIVIVRQITERKQAEDELRRTLSLLSATLESTTDGIVVSNHEGNVVIYNQKFTDMWRIPSTLLQSGDNDKVMELVFRQLKNPDVFRTKIDALMGEGQTQSFDILEFMDGRIFECYSLPQLIGGKSVGRVWSFRDVTERRQVDEELHKSEERFKMVARATNDAVWDWDFTTNTVWWNEGVNTLFGYKREEVRSDLDWWYGCIHSKDREKVVQGISAILIGTQEFWTEEYRFRKADGSYAFILDRAYVLRNELGKPVRILGAMMDITERKRAEESVRQSEQRYRDLVETMNEFVMELDTSGILLFVNRPMALSTGYQVQELVGSNFYSYIHTQDIARVLEQAASMQDKGAPVRNTEYRFRRKDGSYLHLVANVDPIFDANQRLRATLQVAFDLTQTKRAEDEKEHLQKQLLQSEKMAAVGQLAGGVAHEINNPLGVILGFAQILRRQIGNGHALFVPVESIEREARRCKILVQDLLTFSRASRGQKESCSLNEVIDTAMSLVRAQTKVKSVELVQELEKDLPRIQVNSNQIQQVVVNLCNNAIDAMPEGGKLTVRTAAAQRDGKPCLEIQVEDTGTGIPKDIQSRIFEPFFTTKEVGKGTGLGLSLVYEIVQKHDGRIELKSGPKQGTLFKVQIPLADPDK